jgi:hypothetical protein
MGAVMKTFRIQPGYRARADGQWHRFGDVVHVDEGQTIEVHLVQQFDAVESCIGAYAYTDLDIERPPMGLGRARQV